MSFPEAGTYVLEVTTSDGELASSERCGKCGSAGSRMSDGPWWASIYTSASESLVYLTATMGNEDHTPGAGFAEQVEVYAGSGAGNTAGLYVADGTAVSAPFAFVQGAFSSDADFAVVALEIEYLPEPNAAAMLAAGVAILWEL